MGFPEYDGYVPATKKLNTAYFSPDREKSKKTDTNFVIKPGAAAARSETSNGDNPPMSRTWGT